MCANVDLYSGMVYRSLGISKDLYTPPVCRSTDGGLERPSHRGDLDGGRIIRPAYKAVARPLPYVPLTER